MKDSIVEFLVINIAKIEAIVRELPRIGKRSELKEKADDILRLTAMVRSQAYALEQERVTAKYMRDLGQMFGEVRSGKKEGGESAEG